MAINSYPNVTWDQFNVCNDDKTTAFEDMCRRIFTAEFLKGQSIPHSDHNTPGVEVLPICEIDEFNGKKRRISFQSKYFYQGSVDYSQIKKSARQIAKKYKGDLDLVYLFSNKTITVKSKSFEDIKNILKPANIDIYPISNSELLDLVVKYLDIANYFFLPRRVADSNDILLSGFLSGFKLNNSTGEIVFTPSLLVSKDDREQILEEVISEKVTKCKEYILNLDLEGFKKETDHILKSKINSINSVEELYFLNAIVLIYKNADATEFINKCKDHYDEEIKQFQSICNSTIAFGVYEFLQLSPEAEVLLIDKLFQNQEWSNISDIYKREKDIENTYVKKQIVLHYGLSLFNIHKFKESYGNTEQKDCAQFPNMI
ncbi:MAG: hypothetical protein IK990_13095 [Ruminiclostridium sp.]|nr:hypothetical protein [Ruminiclostridium sp.]